ncbi:hypothetical protein, partial [Acetobacter senegalensis]|uniref:hypothetical protein n=1 Tax=Acetobacter senegalensis TaxID=446692 RepID=UPI0026568103
MPESLSRPLKKQHRRKTPVFRTMTLQKRVFTAYRQRRKPQLKNGIRITFQTAEKATSAENSRFP